MARRGPEALPDTGRLSTDWRPSGAPTPFPLIHRRRRFDTEAMGGREPGRRSRRLAAAVSNWCAVAALLGLASCQPTAEEKLAAMGLSPEPASFVAAARDGNASAVHLFLELEVDLQARDTEGRTALIHAAERGFSGIAATLLQHGAVPDLRGPGRRTALFYAVEGRHSGIARALLERGADPGAVDERDLTPFLIAVISGDVEMIRQLLDAGADLDGRDRWGQTPLMQAADRGPPAVVELLLTAGAEPNARSADKGVTPLGAAVAAGREEVVRLLLTGGADPGARSCVRSCKEAPIRPPGRSADTPPMTLQGTKGIPRSPG